jgi:hypothetical protein
MTESDWYSGDQPLPLLLNLCCQFHLTRTPRGRRKLRLFAVACCRRLWDLVPDMRSRIAIDVAERYADGLATRQELDRVRLASKNALFARICDSAGTAAQQVVAEAAVLIIRRSKRSEAGTTLDAYVAEQGVQCRLLREVVGNPFRPIRTPTGAGPGQQAGIMSMAEMIYQENRFADLPILADALEDDGCDNSDVLSHCRESGDHVRGCWALDLVRGKG